MNPTKLQKLAVVVCLSAVTVVSGCHKKAPAAPPPPPPPPAPAPTAGFTVSPAAIDPGQAATLTWQTANATDVFITGIGRVGVDGSHAVSAPTSVTYTLTAKGPGGTAEANARLTVNPPPPKPAPIPPSMSEDQLFDQNIHDVYFDYDKYDLRSQDSSTAEQDADFLKKYPAMKIVVEGHCDERGSEEYNIALGQSRAESLQKALVSNGIDASRIRVISLGKEKPFCTESNEQCWQQNRRDHLYLDR